MSLGWHLQTFLPKWQTVRDGRIYEIAAAQRIPVTCFPDAGKYFGTHCDFECTISRLESGGRKPTLELLLPLARAYDVGLDELVRAPKARDPRVEQKPFVKDGMTFIPLTRSSGGLQAYKMIFPGRTGAKKIEQRVHDGYEWMYVLRGRLQLALGDRDIVLRTGEVAEFDTRVPHACASAGAEPVEVLSLFGSQGERIHVRAGTSR